MRLWCYWKTEKKEITLKYKKIYNFGLKTINTFNNPIYMYIYM